MVEGKKWRLGGQTGGGAVGGRIIVWQLKAMRPVRQGRAHWKGIAVGVVSGCAKAGLGQETVRGMAAARTPAGYRIPRAFHDVPFRTAAARSPQRRGNGLLIRNYLCAGHQNLQAKRCGSDLACGDTSPFFHWKTCLPVAKRGHVRALQIRTLALSQRAGMINYESVLRLRVHGNNRTRKKR